MKKLISVLLAVCFVLYFTCAFAENPVVYQSGEWSYLIQDDGSLVITYCSGKVVDVKIPESLDGKPVAAIRGSTFPTKNSLVSVTIPDSVNIVDGNPFPGCKNLVSVNISPDHPQLALMDGVLFDKTDKRLIWYPCSSEADYYEIPSGIRVIGKSAFWMSSLVRIFIPSSVTVLEEGALGFSASLQDITIPESVTDIGDDAFYGCDALTEIKLPDSITLMGENPFQYCDNLKSIYVSPDHPYLASIDGVLFSKPDKRLICYPYTFNATSYQLPSGIRIIDNYAFHSNQFLKSVVLPDGLVEIRKGAFSECSYLNEINIPDSVVSIGDSAFSSCKALTSLALPASISELGNWAFSGCESLIVTVVRDSYAKEYCAENDVKYTYEGVNDWLNN